MTTCVNELATHDAIALADWLPPCCPANPPPEAK